MPPIVKVSPKLERNQISHDVSLSDGTQTVGLIFDNTPNFQRIPMTETDRLFAETQSDWTSGRGRKKLRDDPSGYFDSKDLWSMTPRKAFPNPQWFFATNFRSVDSAMPGSVTFKKLIGTSLAIAQTFTAGSSDAADKTMLLIRRVGSPGTLTFKLAANNATPTPDEPGSVTQTVTKTTSDITDYVSVYEIFDWSGTQARVASTAYWVYVYGATTDSETNHWEVACNASGTGALISASGTSPSWGAASPDFSMYYRVMDADVSRRLYFFRVDGAQYIMSANTDNSTAPKLWIVGDRGKLSASSAVGATTVTDNAFGCSTAWAADEKVPSRIKFIGGTGAGQRSYQITANTNGGVMTITPALQEAVDNTTRYVIYASSRVTEITGHGATKQPTCKPFSANKIGYILQGTATSAQRFQEDTSNTNNHGFASVASAKYDVGSVFPAPNTGLRMWVGKREDSSLYYGTITAWGGVFSFAAVKGTYLGSSDAKMTGIYAGAKTLYVGKEDGLWMLDETTPKQLTLPIKDVPRSTNCAAIAAPDEDTVYFSYGNSLGQLVGTQQTDLLNYRAGYDGLPANRRGYVSAIATDMGWLFFAVDGGADNYSTVYAWNKMGIHEIWRGWKTGIRVRDIGIEPCEDTRNRLWIDANGEPVYIELPFDTANPRLDSTLNYQHEFVLETGVIDVDKEDFYKLVSELKVMSENLSAGTRWVEVDYKLNEDVDDTTVAWQPFGKVNKSPVDRKIFNLGGVLKFKVRFRAYSTSSTTPPVMTMYDLRGEMAEPPRDMWIGTFRVGGNPPKTLNNQKDFDPTWLVEWLQEAHSKKKKLHMRAARSLDDDKIVTILRPADVADYIKKGDWGGRVTLQIRETTEDSNVGNTG